MQSVINGDCLKTLANIEDGAVQVVVTSPPYNIGKQYKSYKDKRADYLIWMSGVLQELHRVLDSEGHLFLQVGGTPTRPTLPHQILQLALLAGFELQNEIVWVKNIAIDGDSHGHFKPINSPRFVNSCHEFIYHLTKKGNAPIDRLSVGVPFKDKSNLKRFKHTADKRCSGSVWFIPYETVKDQDGKHNHPAGFPLELPLRCIQLSGAKAGDTVLDPFLGAGTTLVAAKKLGINGIGIELDKSYCETALDRIKKLI